MNKKKLLIPLALVAIVLMTVTGVFGQIFWLTMNLTQVDPPTNPKDYEVITIVEEPDFIHLLVEVQGAGHNGDMVVGQGATHNFNLTVRNLNVDALDSYTCGLIFREVGAEVSAESIIMIDVLSSTPIISGAKATYLVDHEVTLPEGDYELLAYVNEITWV